MTRFLATLAAVSALVVGVLVPTASASAAPSSGSGVSSRDIRTTLVGFDAGNIISDAVFFNSSSMSAPQIQTFLNSKVPTCRTGGDQYGPYVCLKDYKIATQTKAADQYCRGYEGAAIETAAQIIAKVAQSCRINPQVLLVMLQKEQSLVLNVWPSAWRYEIAMGHECPDFRECNPAKKGFLNQVYGAARQMQIYAEGKYFTYYAPGKTWNIRYSPDVNCGSSPVYVANVATSAMYYYTPYQPNAAALAAGTGEAPCGAYGNRNFYNYFTDWFGSTQGTANNPFGNIELVQALPGQFQVSGWAADRNTTAPIGVHVYVGPVGSAFTADLNRTDVGAAYPEVGSNHGFDIKVSATGPGPVDICIYGINVGAGANVLFLCKTVEAMSGSPVGAVDPAKPVDKGVEVSGWAIDPDTTSPATVHVYVDAVGTAYTADKQRSGLDAKYAPYGDKHGFSMTVPATPGTHDICVYGINSGPGANVLLGCQKVEVSGIGEMGRAPIGALESITVDGTTATATGWAIDPDTAAPIVVHLYVGPNGQAYTANKDRPDIAAKYPAYGSKHGFSEKVMLPLGKTDVCAYGINTGAGGHALLGCKTVTVASPVEPDLGRAPFGNFEGVTVETGAATVSGWAIDPDTVKPIAVHIYVDSTSAAYLADKDRADVGAFYPASGPKHGFAERIVMTPGQHTVCAYAINNGAGGHAFLGCRTVTIPAPSPVEPDLGRAPFGNFEGVTVETGAATVSGWAIDPDTVKPIAVHIYVDSTSAAYLADKDRADVGAFYPASGPKHGFAERIVMTPGQHTVCAYAINNGAGGHAFLGCRTVTVK